MVITLFITNIFSPNGDGSNDVFRVYLNQETSELLLKIYDRWGNIHHTTTDPNATWTAEDSRAILRSGVYIYHIQYKVIGESKERILSGSVTVVRRLKMLFSDCLSLIFQ
ncbi:MAG: gliding motility-associated C-terminal domain-containing protein [Saprospiraceae bacterium]